MTIGVQNHEKATIRSLTLNGSVAASQKNAIQQKGKKIANHTIVEIMAMTLALF